MLVKIILVKRKKKIFMLHFRVHYDLRRDHQEVTDFSKPL